MRQRMIKKILLLVVMLLTLLSCKSMTKNPIETPYIELDKTTKKNIINSFHKSIIYTNSKESIYSVDGRKNKKIAFEEYSNGNNYNDYHFWIMSYGEFNSKIVFLFKFLQQKI